MQAIRKTDPNLLLYPHTRTDRNLRPRFCLSRRQGELYFVNHSDETLTWVANGSVGGFSDQTEGAVLSGEARCRYDAVQPKEAVLIDVFDDEFDADMYIASEVALASPTLGELTFFVSDKGGQGSIVLLWQDGFVSPHARMSKRPAESESK